MASPVTPDEVLFGIGQPGGSVSAFEAMSQDYRLRSGSAITQVFIQGGSTTMINPTNQLIGYLSPYVYRFCF